MSPAPLRPSYPEELAIGDLDTAETFVVATARLWAAPHRDPWHPHPDWRGGFRAAGIDTDGTHAFDTLFWIVVAGGHRVLDIRCPRCPRLGADEAWLLQMVGYSQMGRPDLTEIALGHWLPAAAARAAVVHATIFGSALSAGGLMVPLHRRITRPASTLAAATHQASSAVH
jgi:hypothetical protein